MTFVVVGEWPGDRVPIDFGGEFGHPAADIPSGGDDVSPLANDGILSADQYAWQITSLPGSGTLTATDAGAVSITGVSGSTTAGYTVYILRGATGTVDTQANTISFSDGSAVNERSLTAAGAAAVTWQAGQTELRSLSSNGVGAASFVGEDANSGLSARTLASDGVASVSWLAASFQASSLSSAGVGSFSALAASIEPRALSSSGVAAVSFDGSNAVTIESRTLGSAAVASVSFIGIDTEAQAGFAGFDVDFESPLWWKRKKDGQNPEEASTTAEPVKPKRLGSEAIAEAKRIIAETAREHVERGATVPKSARFAEVRNLLKPLGKQAMQFNWPDLYQRLYQQALDDAIRTELELEATLEALRVEEDDLALEMLLLEA